MRLLLYKGVASGENTALADWGARSESCSCRPPSQREDEIGSALLPVCGAGRESMLSKTAPVGKSMLLPTTPVSKSMLLPTALVGESVLLLPALVGKSKLFIISRPDQALAHWGSWQKKLLPTGTVIESSALAACSTFTGQNVHFGRAGDARISLASSCKHV